MTRQHPGTVTFVTIREKVERVEYVLDSTRVPAPVLFVPTSLGDLPVVRVVTSFDNGYVETRSFGLGGLLLRRILRHPERA